MDLPLRPLLIDCRIELRKAMRQFDQSDLCHRLDTALAMLGTGSASPGPGAPTSTSTSFITSGPPASAIRIAFVIAVSLWIFER